MALGVEVAVGVGVDVGEAVAVGEAVGFGVMKPPVSSAAFQAPEPAVIVIERNDA